jgi:hypothetical protein
MDVNPWSPVRSKPTDVWTGSDLLAMEAIDKQ